MGDAEILDRALPGNAGRGGPPVQNCCLYELALSHTHSHRRIISFWYVIASSAHVFLCVLSHRLTVAELQQQRRLVLERNASTTCSLRSEDLPRLHGHQGLLNSQRAPRKNDRTRIPVQLFIDECKKADSLGIYVQAICLDSDAFVGKTGWSHMHKALHDSLPGKLYTYMGFEYTLNSAHALQYQIFLLLWTIESGSLA